MNTIIYKLLSIIMIGYSCSHINTVSNMQQKNCLTIENFNSLASYIEDHGKQIRLSERLLSDKKSLVLEISIGKRFIELEDYQDYIRIIIIDNNGDHEIPPYFVSNENKEIRISAYYSRLDTEEDVKIRANDWCDIISEFAKK